jgi:hypothetical protein
MAERMCGRIGAELLADDVTGIEVLPVGGLQVLASDSTVWLSKRGCDAKAPVRVSQAAAHPADLVWIVSLAFDDAAEVLELRELRGADAVSALLPSLVRFERTSTLWAREQDFLAHLVSQSRVLQATRSHDVTADTVAARLLALLAGERR